MLAQVLELGLAGLEVAVPEHDGVGWAQPGASTAMSARPAARSRPTRATAYALAAAPSGTTKTESDCSTGGSTPSAVSASTVRSTPSAQPMPGTWGPPMSSASPS